MNINLIVAVCNGMGMGLNNSIPWYYPSDLKYFSKLTKGSGNNSIIMGRKTWESLPKRPLPKRENIILSRNISDITLEHDELYFDSLEGAIDHCKEKKRDEVWIIGGREIYNLALNSNIVNYIYITTIEENFTCDIFFPEIPQGFKCISKNLEEVNDTKITYRTYIKDQ